MRLAPARLARRLLRRASWPAFAAILFLGFRFLLTRSVDADLQRQAEEVSKRALSDDGTRWNVSRFRGEDIKAESWAVFARDRTVFDVDGFVLGIVPPVERPDYLAFDSFASAATAAGERWRLYSRQLTGGYVVVGFAEGTFCPSDDRLRGNALRFKTNLEKAAHTGYGEMDRDVDWAVVADGGEVQNAFGGIPLKLKIAPSRQPRRFDLKSNGARYRVLETPLRIGHGKALGSVRVAKDVSSESGLLGSVILISGLASAAIIVVAGLVSRIRLAPKVGPEEAIRSGESDFVEFKEAFGKDAVQAVVAFLNGKGGQVFIGVADSGKVVGIQKELARFDGLADRFLAHLIQELCERIGKEFAGSWQPRVLPVSGGEVCAVDVDPGRRPAYFHGSGEYPAFVVRSGNTTRKLNVEEAADYIREHWG